MCAISSQPNACSTQCPRQPNAVTGLLVLPRPWWKNAVRRSPIGLTLLLIATCHACVLLGLTILVLRVNCRL